MRRFAQIALGSAYELDTLLIIAADAGYHDEQRLCALREELASLSRRMQSFIRYQQLKAR